MKVFTAGPGGQVKVKDRPAGSLMTIPPGTKATRIFLLLSGSRGIVEDVSRLQVAHNDPAAGSLHNEDF